MKDSQTKSYDSTTEAHAQSNISCILFWTPSFHKSEKKQSPCLTQLYHSPCLTQLWMLTNRTLLVVLHSLSSYKKTRVFIRLCDSSCRLTNPKYLQNDVAHLRTNMKTSGCWHCSYHLGLPPFRHINSTSCSAYRILRANVTWVKHVPQPSILYPHK